MHFPYKSCIDEKKFEKTYSVKRVTFEDKSNKTCTDLESAKRRNTELIKVNSTLVKSFVQFNWFDSIFFI